MQLVEQLSLDNDAITVQFIANTFGEHESISKEYHHTDVVDVYMLEDSFCVYTNRFTHVNSKPNIVIVLRYKVGNNYYEIGRTNMHPIGIPLIVEFRFVTGEVAPLHVRSTHRFINELVLKCEPGKFQRAYEAKVRYTQ